MWHPCVMRLVTPHETIMENHVAGLLHQTQDPDPEIRRQSASALGQLPQLTEEHEVIHQLKHLLQDEELAVREAAKAALVARDGRTVVKALIPCLESPSPTMLNYAIEILSQRGDAAIDLVFPLLESKDHDIRKFGCDILGNLHYGDNIYALIELLSDPNVNVAIAAGEALGKIGKPEAVPYLIKALQHPDTWMKCIAAEALGKIGDLRAIDPLITMSGYEDPIVLYTVIKAMGNFEDPRVLPYILSTLRSNPILAASACQAIEHLAIRQGDSIYQIVKMAHVGDYFLRLLHHENLEVLQSAITIVGKLHLKEAVPQLGALLNHPDPQIVERAATALRRMGEPGIQELHRVFAHHLTALAPTSPEAAAASSASSLQLPLITALGDIGAETSISLLVQAVQATMPQAIRIEAATALGNVLKSVESFDQDDTTTSAFQSLLTGLTDPCDTLRMTCAHAVGEIDNPEALEPLSGLLQDDSVGVREAASIALAKLQSISLDEKIAVLRRTEARLNPASPYIDAQRATMLRTFARSAGEHEADRYMAALQDRSPDVRTAAVDALQTLSPTSPYYPQLNQHIMPLLHDADFRVRIAALQTLTQWDTYRLTTGQASQAPSAVDAHTVILQQILTLLSDAHPRVQYEACHQLIELVPLRPINAATRDAILDALLHLLQQADVMVKIAAIDTLVALKSSLRSRSQALPVFEQLVAHTNDTTLKKSLQQALTTL
ncbi:hypothetical protein GF339_10370 [candidate division KSB3 bacterium]|uniref:HEAT repeat domain-containing protein n=1 Tax=candidate division KSB3 bacterium TaxID=2044937 RepID=A0A9D5JVM2_9BACT|nr:hypothetical protein [candidate division KSB3 bacterium]MBD3324980.1 hypothetical protein [candidate division KSB3 bacterium]